MTSRRSFWLGIFVALTSITPALAETLTCSTSFQGYRVCQGPGGYRSTEWSRYGMQFGDDNRGTRWTTSRWQGIDITTITPPPDRR
jgi:hypothetical protein